MHVEQVVSIVLKEVSLRMYVNQASTVVIRLSLSLVIKDSLVEKEVDLKLLVQSGHITLM
jgi:hypothetical protein